MIKFSEAELKLIEKISSHWYTVIQQTDINPPKLYDILAIDAFIQNRQGAEIEALRKVVNAIHKCHPYRFTPEFDELCKF